ncbi:hypothetical protein A4R44_03771 [Amycolatopsis sp. M39]|nr:hypothetical protein A4R44_03771 [Amycolatopsis sp. M39]
MLPGSPGGARQGSLVLEFGDIAHQVGICKFCFAGLVALSRELPPCLPGLCHPGDSCGRRLMRLRCSAETALLRFVFPRVRRLAPDSAGGSHQDRSGPKRPRAGFSRPVPEVKRSAELVTGIMSLLAAFRRSRNIFVFSGFPGSRPRGQEGADACSGLFPDSRNAAMSDALFAQDAVAIRARADDVTCARLVAASRGSRCFRCAPGGTVAVTAPRTPERPPLLLGILPAGRAHRVEDVSGPLPSCPRAALSPRRSTTYRLGPPANPRLPTFARPIRRPCAGPSAGSGKPLPGQLRGRPGQTDVSTRPGELPGVLAACPFLTPSAASQAARRTRRGHAHRRRSVPAGRIAPPRCSGSSTSTARLSEPI